MPAPDETLVREVLGTNLGHAEDLRYPPTASDHVALLAGRDQLDDCIVLGTVVASYSEGIGEGPHLTYDLKRAAALLGADAVLDVSACNANCLIGIAVRKRDKGPQ